MNYKWTLDVTRVMACRRCGCDVPVNINYHIESVTCIKCYQQLKVCVNTPKETDTTK